MYNPLKWRRKPEAEIATIERWHQSWLRSLRAAFIFALCVSGLLFVLVQVIPVSRVSVHPANIRLAALFASIAFVLFFVPTLMWKRAGIGGRIYICDKCQHIEPLSGPGFECSCGGRCEPLDHWQWRPDENSKDALRS